MTGPTALSANERFTRESSPLPWLYRTLRGPVRRALARWFDLQIDGLEPGLPGVALLALRSGVPVVPAGIRGTFEALAGRRGYIPRRVPLGVRFGPARRFSVVRAASRRGAGAPLAEARLHIEDGTNDRRS